MAQSRSKRSVRLKDLRASKGGAANVKGGSTKKSTLGSIALTKGGGTPAPAPSPTPTTTPTPSPN